MAGIDFMTIAAWLGHKNGGILVGKLYGHLLDEHRSAAAQRLSFTDVRSTDLQEPHPSPSWASNANAMDSINSPPPDKDPLANQIRS
jgi:hypothetical protein